MVAAVRVHKPGGPEALTYEDIDVGAPSPGQIRIKKHNVDPLHCRDATSRQHRLGHPHHVEIGFRLQPCCDRLGEGPLPIYDKNADPRHVSQPG